MKEFMIIDTPQLEQFKGLVQLRNLRFCAKPITLGRHTCVEVDADHLSAGALDAFYAAWKQLHSPAAEKQPTLWARLLRIFKGQDLMLSPA